jgi:arginase
MKVRPDAIQLLVAPSILGLQSQGVELLPDRLLSIGLVQMVQSTLPIIKVPTLNRLRSSVRDPETHCLNPEAIRDFSITLSHAVADTTTNGRFGLVLGGDCSIMIGIMAGLKAVGNYGLVFVDAHADFYEPKQSPTGEVADMDLAIVTGRGPEMLTNIGKLRPYVSDGQVIHVGQRDWEETQKFGSQDIKSTGITCYDLDTIEREGVGTLMDHITPKIRQAPVNDFWIHFDTDALSDSINPAVDYRIPGGLSFSQAETIIGALLSTGRIAGLSVTIYNPTLDPDGQIASGVSASIGRMFTQ